MDTYLRIMQLALVGLGLWHLGETGRKIWRSLESAHWATTPGKIVSASADHHFDASSDLPTGHSVSVRYEYEVGQQHFTGERVSFIDGGPFTGLLGQRERDELTRRYVVGNTVPVYYSANAPSVAVLEPGVQAPKAMLHILGGAFLIVLGTKEVLW